MWLKLVKLTNYRQYEDATIEFNYSPDKPVAVILGQMGWGKTNILNAVSWALFGTEPHLTNRPSQGLPILSKHLTSGKTKVEVTFQDESNNSLIAITRTKEESKKATGLSVYIIELIGRSAPRILSGGDAEMEIYKLLHIDIQQYFLFNGEAIYKMLQDTKQVKEAFEYISEIGLLDDTVKHIDNVKKEINRNIKPPKGKDRSINTEKINLEVEVEDNTKKIEELKEKNAKLETDKTKKSDEIIRLGNIDVQKLQKNRINYEESLKIKRKQLKSKSKELSDKILQYGPLIICAPKIDLALEKIKNLLVKRDKDKTYMPHGYDEIFLKDLIELDCCICGKKFKENPECKNTIEDLLKTNRSHESKYLTKARYGLRFLLNEIRDFPEEFANLNNDILNLENDIKNIQEEISKINVRLSSAASKKIADLTEERNQISYYIDNNRNNYSVLEAKNNQNQESIKMLKKKLDEALKNNKEYRDAQNKIKICERSINFLNDYRNKVIKQNIRSVEATMYSTFIQLSQKTSIKKIQLDKDTYKISVKNQQNQEEFGTLSQGETQLLALSFLAGIRKSISIYNFPIIADTALGRLSTIPRLNMSQFLPNAFENKQLILLVTDTEFSDIVQKHLSNQISDIFEITRDKITDLSSIKKINISRVKTA